MSYAAQNSYELKKAPPNRYPSNIDSIGIELVGKSFPPPSGRGEPLYEAVTAKQNFNLRWLVRELTETLHLNAREVFRHPLVSRKTSTEAATARW